MRFEVTYAPVTRGGHCFYVYVVDSTGDLIFDDCGYSMFDI